MLAVRNRLFVDVRFLVFCFIESLLLLKGTRRVSCYFGSVRMLAHQKPHRIFLGRTLKIDFITQQKLPNEGAHKLVLLSTMKIISLQYTLILLEVVSVQGSSYL